MILYNINDCEMFLKFTEISIKGKFKLHEQNRSNPKEVLISLNNRLKILKMQNTFLENHKKKRKFQHTFAEMNTMAYGTKLKPMIMLNG